VVATAKSGKDGSISFRGNRDSVPYLDRGRELQLKTDGAALRIGVGDQVMAPHPIAPGRGRMIRREEHFTGMPLPAYPPALDGLKPQFLHTFPGSEAFRAGILRVKAGNARAHLVTRLNLTQRYPAALVAEAVARAQQSGADEVKTVRHLCRAQAAPTAPAPQVPVTSPHLMVAEPVVVRPLTEYALVAEPEVSR